MDKLKITGYGLSQMCRLCLSCDTTKSDVFLFSADLGKRIADVIMECVPVQITKHDKMPTNICLLCFTQLKTFHQFQMQAVQSDRTLQRYLQQLSDCHPQIKVEWALEEQSNNSVSQNYNAEVTAKCEPLEISDEFDIFYSKEKVPANFSAVKKTNEEIFLKSEFKDEPIDDNSLISVECVNSVETLYKCDGSEISCKDSIIEISDTKVGVGTPGNFDCTLKFENGMTENIPGKSEETYIPLKDSEYVCSNDDNLIRTEHPSKSPNFNEKLDVCKKLFKKSTASTRSKSHQCDVCQMCFNYACHLKKHKLKHSGEKPYQCDVCKMCFSLSGNLKKHHLIHTGEKPYQCDVCKMNFTRTDSLKDHKLLHTGEKPFQCDVCKMCFRRTDSLKDHKLLHTGERPYQCDICKKCFTQSRILKRHNLIHTGEKPYQCDICKMFFRRADCLNNHKLKHRIETTSV